MMYQRSNTKTVSPFPILSVLDFRNTSLVKPYCTTNAYRNDLINGSLFEVTFRSTTGT